jgi:prepilin-type N-terminal cleavage/methylation domain-containing protein
MTLAEARMGIRIVSHHPTRTLDNARGFSLMEVLAVLGLMAVLTGFAANKFMASQPNFRVRGAALEVAGDMSIARLSAVKEGRIYQFVPAAGGYTIRYDAGGGAWTTVKTVTIASDFPTIAFGFTGITKDPYGTAIAAAVPGTPIIFHSNGTVQSPAGIFLQTSSTPLSQQAVSVTGAGRIRVWKWNGSVWG